MTNMYCFQPPFRRCIRLLLGSRYFYEKSRSPWEKNEEDINAMMDRIREDAAKFKKQFEADVQFIFSRVQHHWHPKNKKGDREAPKYCKPKGKACLQCKRGFPKRVMCDKFGKIRPEKYRVRVVCKGVASEMHLQVSGRRNMLGSILGKRRCPWFAPTAKVLSHVFRSNTNVQTNYRMPLTEHTHDRDCQKKECLSPEQIKKMMLLCQRAMSSQLQSFGRFGSVNDSLLGYIVHIVHHIYILFFYRRLVGVSLPLGWPPRTWKSFRFVRVCDARCLDVKRSWSAILMRQPLPFSLFGPGGLPFSLVSPSESK